MHPFVAAGVLVNSIDNLQASALYVAGQQWLVLRAYILHTCLLAGAARLLVPLRGINGYGWAEIFACGGYVVLHVAGRRFAPVSYRQLGWLAFVFLLPPFTLLVHNAWSFLFWAPLLLFLSAKALNGLRTGLTHPGRTPRAIDQLSSLTHTGT